MTAPWNSWMPKKPAPFPGIKSYFESKTGKRYSYHRATGKRVMAEYGTAEFVAEVARLNEEAAERPKPTTADTLGELIVLYRAVQFQSLSERTRADYQKVFDYLTPMHGLGLSTFTSGGVVKIRDKAFAKHKRRFANYVVAVLSVLFEFACERELVEKNPVIRRVKKIRRPKGTPDANRPWTDKERFVVLREAPMQLRVPLALCAYIGLREGDALAFQRASYNGQDIEVVTSKAGVRVWWKCPRALKLVLDTAPAGKEKAAPYMCLTSRLQPWTESGFRASWRRLKLRLEKEGKIGPGLTIHGLRHTVATYLRQEGFDSRTIADALAQKREEMAMHYSKTADLRKKMVAVTEAIDRMDANEQVTRVV